MKVALCASLLLLWQAVAPAAETAQTAYTALRVIGKKLGAETLNRVVEVRGRFGSPEPETWKVTLDEPTARGGLREVDVQHGQISGERTPTARSVGGRMNFGQLNLDSEGVFTVVNQEMQKVHIPFERADYVLRSAGQKGAPFWHLDLYAGQDRVGEFDVAADSGNILKSDFQKKAPKPTAQIDDHAYVQPVPPPPSSRPPADTRRYPEEARRYPDDARRPLPPPDDYRADRAPYRDDRAYRDDRPYRADRAPYQDEYEDDYRSDGTPFVDKVGRHFEKRGRQFKNFFSGNGWSDR